MRRSSNLMCFNLSFPMFLWKGLLMFFFFFFSALYFGLDRKTRRLRQGKCFSSGWENFPLESAFLLKRKNLQWEKHWLPSCCPKAWRESGVVKNYSLGVGKSLLTPNREPKQKKYRYIRVSFGEPMCFLGVMDFTGLCLKCYLHERKWPKDTFSLKAHPILGNGSWKSVHNLLEPTGWRVCFQAAWVV